MNKFSALLLGCALFMTSHSNAQACTLYKEIFWRDVNTLDWSVYTAEAAIPIEPNVFANISSFFEGKTIADYWINHIVCEENQATMDITLESNTIPITDNWVTVWEQSYEVPYSISHEWIYALGGKQFLFRIRMEK